MPSVPLEIETADGGLVARLAGPTGLVPGAVHAVNSGALLIYEGRRADPHVAGTEAHAFQLEFGTPNVAAVAANWLWSQLHGHAAELRVAGQEVPVHHAAIKAALLAAAGLMQPV